MNNQLTNFSYNDQLVRTVTLDGDHWFVLKDICSALGLTTITKVMARLDEDELSQTQLIDNVGRPQKVYVVNEPGLYSVILRSDKPEAKAFKRWVTHDVLPSIKRTGTYSCQTEPQSISPKDYLKAATLVARCRKSDRHILIEILRNGGFYLPENLENIAIQEHFPQKEEQLAIAETLSETIKAYAEQGHSLRHIASLTGFSATTIHRFLRRKQLPSRKTATRIIDIISSELRENEH